MNWNELHMMNWDDLRIIQAVRNEGSYSGAAVTLRIDETTVSRRLTRIERALGVRLFEPVDGVRKPTASCELVASHIQAIARHVAEIGNVGHEATGPVGRFRIGSINSIAEEVLAPALPSLLTANAGITIELLTSSERVNFSRWEADLAVRLRRPERGDFAIQKLVDTQLYFFEPADALGADALVCCYPERLDGSPETEFLKSRELQSAARCITDNARVIRNLIRSRSAVGILPDYLCGDLLADPQFRATPVSRRRDTWLLIQSHLKDNGAARIVIDWIRERFSLLARL
jgi:DNA-binding transcriptional LysR family regulator